MKVKIALQDQLFEKYPDLFFQKDLDMTRTCMCWGVDTGNGWYDILDKMCAAIVAHQHYKKDLPVSFVQIKEKFGGLRAYFDGGDDYVEGVVDMAERMSYVTCEICGAPGEERGGGWINTYCDVCNKEKIKQWAEMTKDVRVEDNLSEENKA
jgi:hypothetical protein